MTHILLVRNVVCTNLRRTPLLRWAVLGLLIAGCGFAGVQDTLGQSIPSTGASGTGASAASQTATAPAAMPTTSPTSMLYPSEDFRLSPGDLISVRLFMDDYSATARVGMDGTIHLPFIGSVPVQGLSVAT